MSWNIVAANRRLLAQEVGAKVKDWGGRIPVALAFANTYHTGMSNLGFQAVYSLFNTHDDVVCERFFLPDSGLAAEYLRTRTPLLSLETQRPMAEFELVAFSLSHENDYPGMLKMLRLAGIAGRRDERGEGDALVLAGGVTTRTNPEPLAEFIDLFLIGDGEILVPALLRAWREARSTPLPKTDRLLHLARSVPGAYAPGFYEAVLDREGRLKSFEALHHDLPPRLTIARAAQLPSPALKTEILTPATEFSNTRLVEIGRGCGRACRFCLAGFAYRPPRTAKMEDILQSLGPPRTDCERVGLVSPAVTDHPQLTDIIRSLTDQGREVTLSSMRVEALTPELIDALGAGHLRSAAIAPEAGTERLRQYINKGLTEGQILEGMELLAEAGLKRLKLYFMLGLPSETRDDVRAIAHLVGRIRDRLRRLVRGRRLLPELVLSIASFVPKPFTPFQQTPMLDRKELKARARIIQSELKKEKGVRVHFDLPKWAYLQTLLSRGDRRTATIIEALDRFDGQLTQALKQVAFNPDYFVTRNMDQDALFPWSFIDHGFEADFFSRELQRAREMRPTPPCQPASCRQCGICPLDDPGPD